MRAWLLIALTVLVGCQAEKVAAPAEPEPTPTPTPLLVNAPGPAPDGMVWIPGGSFEMGSDDGPPDERPAHEVELDGFWMDETEVTNREFSEFVDATGYVTVAEKELDPADFPGADPADLVPGALVFLPPEKGSEVWSWQWVPGAYWRAPEGPGTSIEPIMDHPVTQVAYEDAVAYAEWADKKLPTEAQWEYAAQGGSRSEFIWGDEMKPAGNEPANIWQGQFPRANDESDGYQATAPVKQFAPNGYGLFDMAGNVWEWCADWYRPGYDTETLRNPTGPDTSYDPDEPELPKRILRGGSFLCAANYCQGYRPTARMKTSPDTGLMHAGFRCIKEAK